MSNEKNVKEESNLKTTEGPGPSQAELETLDVLTLEDDFLLSSYTNDKAKRSNFLHTSQ